MNGQIIQTGKEKKIREETVDFNNTLHQKNLTENIPSKYSRIYTLSAHATVSRTDHIEATRSLNNFNRTAIITTIFSNHNGIKLELQEKNLEKHMDVNKMLLNEGSTKIKEEI